MDGKEELRRQMEIFVRGMLKTPVIPAKVTAVDLAAETCDVIDQADNEYFDVRLKASGDKPSEGILIEPESGSWVLIANIGMSESAYFVIGQTVIKSVTWTIGQTKQRLDETGHTIEAGGENMIGLVSDLIDLNGSLIDTIKQITVLCANPGSPSGAPINFAAFDAVKTQFNQLKTRFETLLK